MQVFRAFACAAILTIGLATKCSMACCQDAGLASLQQAASPFFDVGVGIGFTVIQQPENQALLQKHFAYVTPENCMKFAGTQPNEGGFRFDRADKFVDFATAHDLKVVGHCLVWAKDDRTPEWFYQDGDGEASADLLLKRMKLHIETVTSRYRGRTQMWDVVNEALADGNDGYLRDSQWARLLGDRFIIKAFEYAHAVDPDAILIYNDYQCDRDSKRDKLLRLVKSLKDSHAPVHAIGLQGHYELDRVPYEGIETTLKALRQLDIKVVVSELDIDVVGRGRWWADGGAHREELANYDPYKDGCPPDVLQRQAEQYARLFALYRKYSDVILRVSFWNLHDGESWLNKFPWQRVNHPLLFDRQRRPKPAFDAVIAALN